MASPSSLPFALCVVVECPGKPNRHHAVGSVREAADFLVHQWPPEKRGPGYKIAVEACLDALEGNGRADAASVQWAFEKASKEIDIFIGIRTRRGKAV